MVWNKDIAYKALEALVKRYEALQKDKETYDHTNEATIAHQFIDPLLKEVLGWDIRDQNRCQYELNTEAGRPDIVLFPEYGTGPIFLEAKRFGVIKDLAQAANSIKTVFTPDHLALPGLAVDRTPEEQQAINYAFNNGGTWAVLTNFERLRVFNARRDWLVFTFESPRAYLHDFDLLCRLAYPHVLRGSLEELSNQRYRVDVDTDYLNLINHWRERLAKDIQQHTDENAWVLQAGGRLDLPLLREVVQRFIDRLVVIRFAEDHFVIKAGTLQHFYDMITGLPHYYAPRLDGLLDDFFRKFDHVHNSALFAKGVVDEARFSNATLEPLLADLYRARYRSMPADIMGNTYEQYLGKTLALDNGTVATRDNLETRKKQGSYYTPQVLVRYLVDQSLGRFLYGTANGKSDGMPLPAETRRTSRDIGGLRVLDSACGSGSFLIYAYEVLRDFYEGEIKRLNDSIKSRVDELSAQGLTEAEMYIATAADRAELKRLEEYPRLILETHLYGVDLDPQAAEIAVVNLIMRAMEGRHHQKRLPLLLNQNIKVGNSLLGMRADDPRLHPHAAHLATVRRLRADLIQSPPGPAHDRIIADLQTASDALREMLTAEMGLAAYFPDLDRVRPFHWGLEFPEVFFDAAGHPLENAGFAVIVGNPPWEIVKPDMREFYAQFDPTIESKLTRADAEKRIAEISAGDARIAAAWQDNKTLIEANAAYFSATPDYTHQGRGDRATHKLFIERMYGLLQHAGRLGYVVPSGIYTDLGTKELREMLLNEGHIQYIFSFSNERFFFPGVHHSFKFALVGVQKGTQSDGFWAAFRFNPRVAIAPDDLPAFLANEANLIYVRHESLARFSPESLSFMEFQTPRDYEIAAKIYGEHPLVGDESGAWQLNFAREFDMANDSGLFNSGGQGLPLYEGKMIHQFDADFAPPRYWIDPATGYAKLATSPAASWSRAYRFAFREIARGTDERTCIMAVLPPHTFAGHTLWVGVAPDEATLLYYVAWANSFCTDWVVRFKGGTHVTLFLMKSLPLPRLTPGNPFFDALVTRAARLTCTRAEYAALWRAVMGGDWHEGSSLSDPAHRQTVRDEIDALVAHLYGLTWAEFDHLLASFPLVFNPNAEGAARRAALRAAYEAWIPQVTGWH